MALTPAVVQSLIKAGFKAVYVQKGAGAAAHLTVRVGGRAVRWA